MDTTGHWALGTVHMYVRCRGTRTELSLSDARASPQLDTLCRFFLVVVHVVLHGCGSWIWVWPPGNSRDVRQARAVHATTHADHLASAALLTLAPAARRVVWPVVWREKTRDRCGSGAVEHRPIGCIGLSVSARVSAAAAHNRQRTGHGDARKKATRHRTNRSEQNKRDTSPHGNGLMKSWNVSNWDRMRYRCDKM